MRYKINYKEQKGGFDIIDLSESTKNIIKKNISEYNKEDYWKLKDLAKKLLIENIEEKTSINMMDGKLEEIFKEKWNNGVLFTFEEGNDKNIRKGINRILDEGIYIKEIHEEIIKLLIESIKDYIIAKDIKLGKLVYYGLIINKGLVNNSEIIRYLTRVKNIINSRLIELKNLPYEYKNKTLKIDIKEENIISTILINDLSEEREYESIWLIRIKKENYLKDIIADINDIKLFEDLEYGEEQKKEIKKKKKLEKIIVLLARNNKKDKLIFEYNNKKTLDEKEKFLKQILIDILK
jgi:hypothetical protein